MALLSRLGVADRAAAAGTRPVPAALVPGRPAAAFPARAVFLPALGGRTLAAGRPGAAPFTAPLDSLFFPLVVGVLGRRRLLCPGGQEELFQIEFVIR